ELFLGAFIGNEAALDQIRDAIRQRFAIVGDAGREVLILVGPGARHGKEIDDRVELLVDGEPGMGYGMDEQIALRADGQGVEKARSLQNHGVMLGSEK